MKLALRELELWYFLWILFLLKLLCISINLPYFHAGNTVVMSVWAGAPSWHLELLDKLQKRCSTVVLSLAASHEPLTHHQNIASLILFYRYYFVRCSSELAQLVPFPYSWETCSCYYDRLHDFSFTIARCYKDVCVNSFFPHTVRLWNSLPIECFLLTYDPNGFKFKINRHLLTVGSF